MTLQDQPQTSFTGIIVGVVVFLVLALLILIVGISARNRRRSAKPDDAGSNGIRQSDANNSADEGDEEPVASISQLTDGDDPDPELIAVIMAALSIAMGQAGFRLRSIRRTGRNTPAWNLSGRDEYLATRL